MPTKDRPLDVVMSYIKALDSEDYDRALEHLHERVRIRGPAGETFGKPLDFIEMLRKWQGKYDVKKAFADGDDVCVLYDLKTTGPRCSCLRGIRSRTRRLSPSRASSTRAPLARLPDVTPLQARVSFRRRLPPM